MKNSGVIDLPTTGPAPQYPIESVDNALKIIHLLGQHPTLRLTEVATALGVASSTAHRLLAMLQYRGFVRRDTTSQAYRPGSALSSVSFAILQRFDVRETLRPLLITINEELRETVHLATLDGSVVRFIDAIESPQAVRVVSRLGRTMPANCTSSGKSMLATLTPNELREILPNDTLETVTDNSIGRFVDLQRDLELVRERGYAVSDEESESGVSSVAAAFPVGLLPMRLAVNVSVPVNRMDATIARRLGERLAEAVADATNTLL